MIFLSRNGTSMISLIIPPKDQIARVNKMLADEFGTASNIKSRVNRLSVLGAITSVQQRLKLYNKGIAVSLFFLITVHHIITHEIVACSLFTHKRSYFSFTSICNLLRVHHASKKGHCVCLFCAAKLYLFLSSGTSKFDTFYHWLYLLIQQAQYIFLL